MNSKHILLTGGTGLVGSKLTRLLLDKGYTVSHLSRKIGNDVRVKTYLWDINKGQIDEHCIDGAAIIVHLAGAGIADKRWTERRKKEIIESRTKSIELIYKLLKNQKHNVNSVISASATGYYGDRGDELVTEESIRGNNFLGNCCKQWEQVVDEGRLLGLRVLKFRTGVILASGTGALQKLATPIKFGVGSPFGNGKQWIPWIHEQDVIDMYLLGIENENLSGVYNMAAPNPVTNEQLTHAVAKQLHRPLWLPNVPAFILKLLLGEMSAIVLTGTKVSAQKIKEAGFKFKYPEIDGALKEIYSS
jgi:uncharacterized protein (TIGR01777 family)